MRVVDTSIWIEWLIDSPLKQAIAEAFPETVQCIVPTIVQLELDKWLMREASESETDQVIAYTQNCVVAVLDTNIALQAADLHRQYKLTLRMPLFMQPHWFMVQTYSPVMRILKVCLMWYLSEKPKFKQN
jgi:predicted nucleic acid-binding protein